jgi:hypothetical protein
MNRSIIKVATPLLSLKQPKTKGQVVPEDIWKELTPEQQHRVFQTLVRVCRHLVQSNLQEERSNEQQ